MVAAIDDDVEQLFGDWLTFARTASKDRLQHIDDLAARRLVRPTFAHSRPGTGYNGGHGSFSTDRLGASSSELFVIGCDDPPLQRGQFILVVVHSFNNHEQWESEVVAVQVFLVTDHNGQLAWTAMRPVHPKPPKFTLVDDPFEVSLSDSNEIVVHNAAAKTTYVVPMNPP